MAFYFAFPAHARIRGEDEWVGGVLPPIPRCAYRPLNSGFRFSTKARVASW
jgi:hypothetical protein